MIFMWRAMRITICPKPMSIPSCGHGSSVLSFFVEQRWLAWCVDLAKTQMYALAQLIVYRPRTALCRRAVVQTVMCYPGSDKKFGRTF